MPVWLLDIRYAMDASLVIKALGVLFSHKNGACHRVVFLPLVFQFCCKSVFSLIPNKKGERTEQLNPKMRLFMTWFDCLS